MGNSYGKISSPVRLKTDVLYVLTSTLNGIAELTELCTHNSVNPWAKFKPIKYYGIPDRSSNWWRGENTWSNKCGFYIPSYSNSDDLATYDSSATWEYIRPTGGVYPFREYDFAGYNHNAVVPFNLRIPSKAVLDNGNVTENVQLVINQVDSDNLAFSDLIPTSYYFGVTVKYGNQVVANLASTTIGNGGTKINLSNCPVLQVGRTVQITAFVTSSKSGFTAWSTVDRECFSLNAGNGAGGASANCVVEGQAVDQYEIVVGGLFATADMNCIRMGYASSDGTFVTATGTLVRRLSQTYELSFVSVTAVQHSTSEEVDYTIVYPYNDRYLSPTELSKEDYAPIDYGFRASIQSLNLPTLVDNNDYYTITYYFFFVDSGGGGGGDVTLTSISISGANTVEVNSYIDLTVMANYSDGSATNVTSYVSWSGYSSHLSRSGNRFTGTSAGTVTVQASYEGETATHSVTVNSGGGGGGGGVSLSISPTSLNLVVGGRNGTISAVVSGTSSNITWSSSNTGKATVSASGTQNKICTVHPVSTGSCTITASVGGVQKQCSVTISTSTVAVTGVSLNKTTASIVVGGTVTLSATISPDGATNKNVTWTKSGVGISISPNGTDCVVTGTRVANNQTVTVTTNDGGYSKQCTITVNEVAVTSVTVSPSTLNLRVGMAAQGLAVSVLPSNATDKSVTWSSSNTNIATVDQSGNVTPIATGNGVTITATSNSNPSKSGTCTVNVGAALVNTLAFNLDGLNSTDSSRWTKLGDPSATGGTFTQTIKLTGNFTKSYTLASVTASIVKYYPDTGESSQYSSQTLSNGQPTELLRAEMTSGSTWTFTVPSASVPNAGSNYYYITTYIFRYS